MKCEIMSWGQQEVDCNKRLEGDCANCGTAWNYMSLFGPDSLTTERVGRDLVSTVVFNGDPAIYRATMTGGKDIHLEKIQKG